MEIWIFFVLVKLPKYVYGATYRSKNVMKITCILYALKNATHILHGLTMESFKRAGVSDIKGAPFVFKNDEITVISYAYDNLMISKHKYRMNTVKQKLKKA